MTHRTETTKKCEACEGLPQSDARHCHECSGRRFVILPGQICDGEEKYDPGVDGWECDKCGGSGPL